MSSTDKVVLELKDINNNVKKTLSSIPVSEIVDQEPEPDKPIAIITPESPKGIPNQTITLSGNESVNTVKYMWSATGNLAIVGPNDQPTVDILLPPTVEIGLEVILEVQNSIGDKNTKSVVVLMEEGPTGTIQRLNPISIEVDEHDPGKGPEAVNDNDPDTRCSFKGVGKTLRFKFDTTKVKSIDHVVVNCWHLDIFYKYQLGGQEFTCPAGRSPTTEITHDLKALNLSPSEVIITGLGNQNSDYNSFRKVWFYGLSEEQEPPVCPPGRVWSPEFNACIPVCGPGTHYDPILDQCVPDQQPGDLVRILSIGDDDTTSGKRAVWSRMKTISNVSQIIHAGDLSYSSRATGWISQFKEYYTEQEAQDLWMISRGNHDTSSSESKQTQLDLELFFKRYHRRYFGQGLSDSEYLDKIRNNNWYESKIIGNVGIINMDTEDLDIEFKRDQYNFVFRELETFKALRAQGIIDWIIVVCHKPFFTLKSSHSPYVSVRFLYKDIFRDAQVDLVFHGHNHNYQAWKPMIPSDSEANGEGTQLFTLMPDGKTYNFALDHGAIFDVHGNGGHEWNSINDSGSGVINVQHYHDSGKFGFIQADFIGKRCNVKSIDSDGNIKYEYNISREGAGGGDTNPVINATFPSSIEALKQGIIDASASDADNVTIEQTTNVNINLQDAGRWKKSFIPPEVTN